MSLSYKKVEAGQSSLKRGNRLYFNIHLDIKRNVYEMASIGTATLGRLEPRRH